jgi:hypothetical protein
MMKYLVRQLTKGDVLMANTCMKRGSTPGITREMQFKTAMKCPTKMLELRMLSHRNSYSLLVRMKICTASLEDGFIQHQAHSSYDPIIIFVDI